MLSAGRRRLDDLLFEADVLFAMPPTFEYEHSLRAQGIEAIAGIDEAGRGPLAGPVVAAAVILPASFSHRTLDDSKRLSPAQREKIFAELTSRDDLCWAASVVGPAEVDQLNILRASHAAMRRAAATLKIPPQHVLLDGLPVEPFPWPQTALVRGDGRSLSIAAASVIAKVVRDRIMVEMETRHPGYGFAKHKGYPTALHLERLRLRGPCAIHRQSFAPVAQLAFAFTARA